MARRPKTPRRDKGHQHRFSDEKRALAAARIALVRPVEITLRCRHTINGVSYGPGPVRIRKDIAETLQENERNAIAADASFFGTKAAIVGAQKRVIPVPPEMFDTYYGHATPMSTIGGPYAPDTGGGSPL